jgi:hypothetical protein
MYATNNQEVAVKYGKMEEKKVYKRLADISA